MAPPVNGAKLAGRENNDPWSSATTSHLSASDKATVGLIWDKQRKPRTAEAGIHKCME